MKRARSNAGLPTQAQPPLPPGWVLRAGIKLRDLMHRAVDKLVPADVLLLEEVMGLARAHALGAVARLRVADALEAGPRTAADLAVKLGVDADALHRTLRMLSTVGIFSLHDDGTFRNTRRSRALRSAHPSRRRDIADYFTSSTNASAYVDYDEWLKTGRSPFETRHGMNIFERLALHPDEGEKFDQLMMGLTLMQARIVARLYPFREVNRLCDVGGGRGTLLSELLLHHGHLSGVLYDAPAVVESAESLLEHRGVLARVERIGGSFFERVPEGCDAYVLKNVLHDWDDATCVKLLGNVRAVCGSGARVLVVETLLEPNEPDPYGATADVHMGMMCTGRERSRAEFERLFSEAGLHTARVFDGSAIAVVEAVA